MKKLTHYRSVDGKNLLSQSKPDFNKLWGLFLNEMKRISNDNYKIILLNNENNKERICRKLGVVSEQDILRIVKNLKNM